MGISRRSSGNFSPFVSPVADIYVHIMSTHYLFFSLHDECVKELVNKHDHTLDAVVRFVYLCRREFYNHADSSAELRDIIQRALEATLSTINITNLEVNSRANEFTFVIDFVQLCLDTEHHPIASRALEMSLKNPHSTNAQYIKFLLVPLLRKLSASLIGHEVPLAGAFPYFAGEVVRKYVRHVLGSSPVPGATLQDWRNIGCGCGDCNTLASWIRRFKVGSPNRIWRGNKPRRRHLIDQLENMKGWGISWTVAREISKKRKLAMLRVCG
jgi:hypothetical protein